MNKTFKYTLLSTSLLAANAMASNPTEEGFTTPKRTAAGRSSAARPELFSPLVGTPEVHKAAMQRGDYAGTPVTSSVLSMLGEAAIHERNELKRAKAQQEQQNNIALEAEKKRRSILLERIANFELQAGERNEAIKGLQEKIRTVLADKEAVSNEVTQLSAQIKDLEAQAC